MQEVTKEWLANKIKKEPSRVIGRALLAIYKNQTFVERESSATKLSNGIGFCKPDARIGSIGARMYRAHGKLEQWLIDIWILNAKDGYPRICKYAEQLNNIAVKREAAKQLQFGVGVRIVNDLATTNA